MPGATTGGGVEPEGGDRDGRTAGAPAAGPGSIGGSGGWEGSTEGGAGRASPGVPGVRDDRGEGRFGVGHRPGELAERAGLAALARDGDDRDAGDQRADPAEGVGDGRAWPGSEIGEWRVLGEREPPERRRRVGIARAAVERIAAVGADADRVAAVAPARVIIQAEALEARGRGGGPSPAGQGDTANGPAPTPRRIALRGSRPPARFDVSMGEFLREFGGRGLRPRGWLLPFGRRRQLNAWPAAGRCRRGAGTSAARCSTGMVWPGGPQRGHLAGGIAQGVEQLELGPVVVGRPWRSTR